MTNIEQIKAKIRALFGDTSVPAGTTMTLLEEIHDMVEEMIEALDDEDDDANA